MTKKLVKHGNSYAFIIDKPILNMLNITPHTNVVFSVEDNALVIRPEALHKTGKKAGKSQKSISRDKEIDEIADRVMDKYADLLRKLSKT